jgi:hypothetical protein
MASESMKLGDKVPEITAQTLCRISTKYAINLLYGKEGKLWEFNIGDL